jgi:hypothetical protein
MNPFIFSFWNFSKRRKRLQAHKGRREKRERREKRGEDDHGKTAGKEGLDF